MSLELLKIPATVCNYTPEAEHPNIHQASCNAEWLVPQESFRFCPFCGSSINKLPLPPAKPGTTRKTA